MAIAFFSTWTTYGTWLPGDSRGWYQAGRGLQEPDARRRFQSMLKMTEAAITLDTVQRNHVQQTIDEHSRKRGWYLHAVNCRSNHVHVVVTAPNRTIDLPREQFKAWCSNKLNKQVDPPLGRRENWWTERGWDEYIDNDSVLECIIAYVLDGQDWHNVP